MAPTYLAVCLFALWVPLSALDSNRASLNENYWVFAGKQANRTLGTNDVSQESPFIY